MRSPTSAVLAALLAAVPAYGQTPHEPPPSAAEIVSPALVEFVEATYPSDALAAGRKGVVVLKISIDARGLVTAAEIAVSGGADFDAAALDAAQRFRFEPARRGDVPVASRILYEYAFRLPAPKAPDPDPRVPAPSAAPRAPEATSEAAPLEVVVQGQSAGDRLRESARAVQVIETGEAKKQSSSLGDVLARSPGVGVRRDGGLGSGMRLSLNGLSDDQVRVFLDGVPIELAGFAYGIANVPVNLVDRVDVYRGVVPIRFGADALGGAIDLVTDDDLYGTEASASYQFGSFGTERLTLGVRTLDEPSGFFTRVSAFADAADNDYPVDVEWPNELGRPEPLRAFRFHDAYRAFGANVEAGVVDRRWARRLLFRLFIADYQKELQHGTVLTIPYGDVESRRSIAGGSARYVNSIATGLVLDALAGYTQTRLHFSDPDRCFYDWSGHCIREPEIRDPSDYLTRDGTLFSRLNLDWRARPEQTFRLSIAPTFSSIVGDERAKPDPNDGDQRELLTLVGGVEHELSAFDDRLSNIAFVKGYLQSVRADKHVGDIVLERDRDTLHPGLGDSLRYRFTPWLYGKASYEWATRLPNLYEIFGNGVLVLANLELEPETSHNANLSLTVDARDPTAGRFYVELNAFLRDTTNQVLLLHTQDLSMYENVFSARSLGVEAAASWTSPGEILTLTGNATELEFRNTSTQGAFENFAGDRMPNQPYFFVNGSARLQARGVATANDVLSFTWYTRYTHEFFRSWESVGQRDLKEVIPSQLLHTAALVYEVRGQVLELGNSFEVDNVTDQPAYDYFGIQRPGRAFYYKVTTEL